MKKIGKFNLLEENICGLSCDCGWNITIGGENKKDLEDIKDFLKKFRQTIAVLAGNYKQAKEFMRSTGKDNFLYISTPKETYGMLFYHYVIIGTFWERKDANKLLDAVSAQTRRSVK